MILRIRFSMTVAEKILHKNKATIYFFAVHSLREQSYQYVNFKKRFEGEKIDYFQEGTGMIEARKSGSTDYDVIRQNNQ